MVRANRLSIVIILLSWTTAAYGGGWSTPEWRTELSVMGTSDMFPGYSGTAPDRGLRTAIELGTDRRLTREVKLGVQAHGGWLGYSRFGEERHGWGGATLTLRRGGTRLELEHEVTPHRVKFPAAPENAAFRRAEWRIGVRQALHERTRLRVDLMREDDDYVAAFDARDGASLSARGSVEFQAAPTIGLSARSERSGRDTASPDYRHEETETGAGLAWSPGSWVVAAEVRSGVRRYTQAPASDSNFRRRDQWIETLGTVRRRLDHALTLRVAAGFRDQTSSRFDRTYATSTWAVGVEWSGGGD